MKNGAKLILILATTAIAVGGWAFTAKETAPEVRFATLSGRSIATSDLRGKVVLVNFWSTSCEICMHEMPMLSATYRRLAPQGYETIAVAMSYDHPNQVAAYAQRSKLPFSVALDLDGALARKWGDIQATPTTFVVDRRGRIVKRYVGEPSEADFQAVLTKALGEPA